MAQQTINVGTSPNDGTGTPLRTAFQYTNSNFSELYTAVGPSGNNIVVPGSATITGDLTVATNRLSVSSTGVQIGTTTNKTTAFTGNGTGLTIGAALAPTIALWDTTNASYVGSISQIDADMYMTNTAAGQIVFSTDNASRYTISSTGVSTWSVGGSTAMTLNSTGLGVGTVPGQRLDIVSTTGCIARLRGGSGSNQSAALYISNTAGSATLAAFGDRANIAGGTPDLSASIYTNAGIPLLFDVGSSTKATIDASGNVGVGVTPSAWASGFKLVQFGPGSAISCNTNASRCDISANYYYDGANKFITASGYATVISQENGNFYFYRSSTTSGGAGSALTFNAPMVLDASGNLLVGKTSPNATVVGFQATSTGETSSTMAASTSAATTLNVYSTGAAAYRFYVGLNGTISATNTTISAISDARFKENIQDIDVGLGAILALKPRKFDWKEGKGKNIKGDRGFIAQEFEQVFPNLIDEWKDSAPEGEAPYKSVRQDLIPVLVKAIQELTARVQTLEAK